MVIKEISKSEFDSFSKTHVLGSFFQSSTYGTLLGKYGYTDMYVGGYKNDKLVCAFMMLTKSISINVKYGYSPRGFLLDYFDNELLTDFSLSIKKYFSKKGFAFIKINPIITLNIVNSDGTKTLNSLSNKLVVDLENLGYKKPRGLYPYLTLKVCYLNIIPLLI